MYDPNFAWVTIANGGLLGRPSELEGWRAIINAAESYPAGEYIAPFKAPKGPEKPRLVGGLEWEYDGPEIARARIKAVSIACGAESGRITFGRDDDANSAALATLLLLPDVRGAMLSAWGASTGGFHAFLRQFARPLVRLGFTLEPIATGTVCKAIIIRKSRRSIWLTDAQEMTGGQSLDCATFTQEYAPRDSTPPTSAARIASALAAFQRQLGSMFGVAIHATIGAAALRAASTFVNKQAFVWRPSPLLVSMLRVGHGFRGGYAWGELHDGLAWRYDINKAYTAALATPLPLRAALVPAGERWEGKPGVFLCYLEGPGRMPAYVAPWQGRDVGFQLEYWNGARCLCVLASTELDGLRALGFRVRQLGGFAFVRSWTLAKFAAKVAAICAQHGRGSAHERTAKVIGNAVYGKFAERPRHDAVMYSEARPGADWHPMLDQRGEELPDLWSTLTTSYRPGQHVDVAATVTGRVRGWLYEGMATAQAAGGYVVQADTDGFLATVNASDWMLTDASQPGAWRIDPDPQRAIVWGRKGYAFGAEVRAAGFKGLTQGDAEAIAAGGSVRTHYTQRAAPWKSGAALVRAHRTARVIATG